MKKFYFSIIGIIPIILLLIFVFDDSVNKVTLPGGSSIERENNVAENEIIENSNNTKINENASNSIHAPIDVSGVNGTVTINVGSDTYVATPDPTAQFTEIERKQLSNELLEEKMNLIKLYAIIKEWDESKEIISFEEYKEARLNSEEFDYLRYSEENTLDDEYFKPDYEKYVESKKTDIKLIIPEAYSLSVEEISLVENEISISSINQLVNVELDVVNCMQDEDERRDSLKKLELYFISKLQGEPWRENKHLYFDVTDQLASCFPCDYDRTIACSVSYYFTPNFPQKYEELFMINLDLIEKN